MMRRILSVAVVMLVALASCSSTATPRACVPDWTLPTERAWDDLDGFRAEGSQRVSTRAEIEAAINEAAAKQPGEFAAIESAAPLTELAVSFGSISPADWHVIQSGDQLAAFALSDDAPTSAPVRERNSEGWWIAGILLANCG